MALSSLPGVFIHSRAHPGGRACSPLRAAFLHTLLYPEGIKSLSPGLSAEDYPGSSSLRAPNAVGVESNPTPDALQINPLDREISVRSPHFVRSTLDTSFSPRVHKLTTRETRLLTLSPCEARAGREHKRGACLLFHILLILTIHVNLFPLPVPVFSSFCQLSIFPVPPL